MSQPSPRPARLAPRGGCEDDRASSTTTASAGERERQPERLELAHGAPPGQGAIGEVRRRPGVDEVEQEARPEAEHDEARAEENERAPLGALRVDELVEILGRARDPRRSRASRGARRSP